MSFGGGCRPRHALMQKLRAQPSAGHFNFTGESGTAIRVSTNWLTLWRLPKLHLAGYALDQFDARIFAYPLNIADRSIWPPWS